MSISSAEQRTAKRRKTSHSSTDDSSNAGPRGGVANSRSSDAGADSREAAKGVSKVVSRSADAAMNDKTKMPTGGMTRSSVIAMQATDLVAQVGCDCSARLRSFESSVDHVVQSIKGVPDRPAISLQQAERSLRKEGFAIPFVDHRPKPDVKYSFSYLPSRNITVRGDLAAGIATKEYQVVEIAVEMPASTFQEKDYLNYRAFHKRAFYLACITAGLSKLLKDQYEMQYTLNHGNSLMPILQLTSKLTSDHVEQQVMTINILFPQVVCPVSKTLPSKNCVRASSTAQDASTSEAKPTPFYNSTLRWLATAPQLDQFIKRSFHTCESFKDACLLGQIWLRQRGFASSTSSGGFGGEEWASLTALLLVGGGHQGRPLFSERYTSLQLFRAILQVLSNRDLVREPLVIGKTVQGLSDLEVPVFYEADLGVNVLYKMTAWSYARLRHVAQLSLAAMNARNQNNFEATFVRNSSTLLLQFDETYKISTSDQATKPDESDTTFFERFYSTLKRGLGDRAYLIDIQGTEIGSWKPDASNPKVNSKMIQVGLLVHADIAGRTLDHGPTAEEQDEARAFREFWGEKSELRRFRDGRITETLVWSDGSPVTYQIIQYLAFSHFEIPPSSITKISPDRRIASILRASPITAMDAFKIVNTKYQELASKLHSLEGLPLPIRSVLPSDACLRSATIGNPSSFSSAQPIDILIQFDSSTRWPDHLPAIQYTKVAFLTKLGDLLSDADSTLSTRLGLEQTESSTTGFLNTSFLDVIQSAPAPGLSALVFRLRIHHDRELQLLQAQSLKEASSNTRELLTSALAAYKQDFVTLPVHTASVRNLITHFVPLSATIRLFKTWIASHHLTNHFPEAVLEVIAAHAFLHPAPWSIPGTPATGFLRCLHFLAHWDWVNTPLIVDLSLTQDMQPSEHTELETRFQAWRKLDPGMSNVSWFVGTNIEGTGTVWTQNSHPSRVVGARVKALSKASIELVRAQDAAMKEDDWESIFHSGVDEFDFVLHLKSSVVKGNNAGDETNGQSKYKNLIIQEELDVDKIGHDVVQLYLKDLEKVFASSVLFFHGYKGNVIAGLWRPNTVDEKEWRVRLGYSSIPVIGANGTNEEGSALCTINKEGIIAEISNLGQGIVERIEAKH